MTDQSTLLLVRMDTDHPQTPVIGQLWMWVVFLRTRMYAKTYASTHLSE